MVQPWSGELDVLATIGWLSETPAPFREAVLGRCNLKHCRQGDAIYRAGDPPGGLYGLIEGSVGIELSPEDREPYIGTLAQPGFWIGEGSVLTRGPRFLGTRALRDSVFAYLPVAEWDKIVRKDPEAWRWLGLLSLRNSLLAMSIADALMIPEASRRLAAILLILSGQQPAGHMATRANVDVSQEGLARMVGLSRSSIGRLLMTFEADGLIEGTYRHIRVIDRAGLRKAKERSAGDSRASDGVA